MNKIIKEEMIDRIRIYQIRNKPIDLLRDTYNFDRVSLHSYFLGQHKRKAYITLNIDSQHVHLYVKAKNRPWYSLPNNIGEVVVAFIKKEPIPFLKYKKGVKNVTGELPPDKSNIQFLGLIKSKRKKRSKRE